MREHVVAIMSRRPVRQVLVSVDSGVPRHEIHGGFRGLKVVPLFPPTGSFPCPAPITCLGRVEKSATCAQPTSRGACGREEPTLRRVGDLEPVWYHVGFERIVPASQWAHLSLPRKGDGESKRRCKYGTAHRGPDASGGALAGARKTRCKIGRPISVPSMASSASVAQGSAPSSWIRSPRS